MTSLLATEPRMFNEVTHIADKIVQLASIYRQLSTNTIMTIEQEAVVRTVTDIADVCVFIECHTVSCVHGN